MKFMFRVEYTLVSSSSARWNGEPLFVFIKAESHARAMKIAKTKLYFRYSDDPRDVIVLGANLQGGEIERKRLWDAVLEIMGEKGLLSS